MGTFESIYKVKKSIGNVKNINTENCFSFSNHKILITNDVKDLNIINTRDITLVSKKGNANAIKELVKKIHKKKNKDILNESEENRPWGSFTGIEKGSSWQVKRLEVNPKASISLQMHKHRSEHWIIVDGTATVEIDHKILILNKNESTYIPAGAKHRLSKPGHTPLILI